MTHLVSSLYRLADTLPSRQTGQAGQTEAGWADWLQLHCTRFEPSSPQQITILIPLGHLMAAFRPDALFQCSLIVGEPILVQHLFRYAIPERRPVTHISEILQADLGGEETG